MYLILAPETLAPERCRPAALQPDEKRQNHKPKKEKSVMKKSFEEWCAIIGEFVGGFLAVLALALFVFALLVLIGGSYSRFFWGC